MKVIASFPLRITFRHVVHFLTILMVMQISTQFTVYIQVYICSYCGGMIVPGIQESIEMLEHGMLVLRTPMAVCKA